MTSELVNHEEPKTNLDILSEFISAFHSWQLLDDDLKLKVIYFLDSRTKIRLGFCSKSSHELIENAPLSAYKIEITDRLKQNFNFEKEPFDNVTVEINFQKSSHIDDMLQLVFSQKEEHTLIRWMSYPNREPRKNQVIRESCDYREEAVKFAEMWMERCNFEFEFVSVEMGNYPRGSSKIGTFEKCKILRIGAESEIALGWWLQKVPEDIQDVQLNNLFSNNLSISSEFLSSPKILQSKYLYIWGKCSLSEEILLNLNAKRMAFEASELSDQGIRWFLEKLIEEDFDLLEAEFQNFRQKPHPESILKGLNARRWTKEFREQHSLFIRRDMKRAFNRGDCYQIARNRAESASICFSGHNVYISVNGLL